MYPFCRFFGVVHLVACPIITLTEALLTVRATVSLFSGMDVLVMLLKGSGKKALITIGALVSLLRFISSVNDLVLYFLQYGFFRDAFAEMVLRSFRHNMNTCKPLV